MRLSSCSCLALLCALGVLNIFVGAEAPCSYEMCVPTGYTCGQFWPTRPVEKITTKGKCDYIQDGTKMPGTYKALCCDSESGYNTHIETITLKNQARALYGASPNEYPHQIVFKSLGSCGGTIYNKEWIITAAHCAHSKDGVFALENGDMAGKNEKCFVIPGMAHITNATEEDRYRIDKIIKHPDWNPMEIGQGNDIALLHLSRPLPLEKGKIQPMRLESADYVPPYGGKGFAVGFGNVNEKLGRASDDMMEAVGPIHSNTKAISLSIDPKQKAGTRPLRQHLSVGGEDSGLTVGRGDSGGPFICPDENNRPVLCGIASYKTCEEFVECRLPNYYVRVAPFLDFIRKETGNAKQETDLLFDVPMFPEKIPEPEVPGYLVRIGGADKSCTGALLNSRIILTAAECLVANGGTTFAPNLYHIKSGTGLTPYANMYDENRFERDISQNFSMYMKQPLNKFDYGFVYLTTPIKTEYAQLAPEGYQISGESVEYSFNDKSNFMEKRNFVPAGDEDCAKRIEGVDQKVQLNFGEQLCMRQTYSAEAVCERDIGGPLMCEDGKYLCGIKSFQACRYPGMPEIFTNVAGPTTRSGIQTYMAMKLPE